MEIAGLNVKQVLDAYETAAYWSSYSDTDLAGGDPMDNYMAANGTTPSEACRARMRKDVEVFLCTCEAENLNLSACEADQVGHDVWLTRNRHGAGFWARDQHTYGDVVTRDTLDRIAKGMGEVYLYVNTETNTVEHD
jgi:hypothetical protein